jgi:hypothetical protein
MTMVSPAWIDYDVGGGRTRRWCETLEAWLADLHAMRTLGLTVLACGYACPPPALVAPPPHGERQRVAQEWRTVANVFWGRFCERSGLTFAEARAQLREKGGA